ncbi:SHOCT domain-containing protein [Bacillus sp. CRN 9]|nr:SHOCT domain-containing protein [Bacillus sp. CRN 9]
MIQYNSGEVQFKVKKEVQNEVFIFLNFERTENIKKSALDVAGWTFAGNMFFGKAGALAGGLGAQAGKDRSTAALFMVNKETKKKIMLIIKCDSNTLEKLSHFTLSQESFDENKVQPLDKYVQLEKLAKLKEQGILTEDEFTREKEKILND